jgi:hypothetical protein
MRRYAASAMAIMAIVLATGCHRGEAPLEPTNEMLDNTVATKADSIEAAANNRANAMAGDMINSAAGTANDTAPPTGQ